MVQVQKYTIEDESGASVDPDSITKQIKEKDGKPSEVKDIYKMTHIFDVQQLPAENDPNSASTNLLDF